MLELCNPAGMLPKLNVVTVYHLLRLLYCGVVIQAAEVNGLDDIAVSAHQIRSIMRHR